MSALDTSGIGVIPTEEAYLTDEFWQNLSRQEILDTLGVMSKDGQSKTFDRLFHQTIFLISQITIVIYPHFKSI